MLRVGLTGGLGSGKSTVSAMLRECGAHVIEADTVGRELMQPGQPVYDRIVQSFGAGIVRKDGTLDRGALAALAFEQGRARELSLIVHPAVIAEQETWMQRLFARNPDAVAVVESALIFEAERDGTAPGWRDRFDTLMLVTAPKEMRIRRFLERARVDLSDEVQRTRARADAEARISAQIPDEEKLSRCDLVLENSTSLEELRSAVAMAWTALAAKASILVYERDVE